ncbi:cyclodeaminase [Bacillus dakarensis]|uniref:cyclodeaminase n=1 Tax=Robertmurraya dakarensis TaxID=1926278 RepID=UPI00098209B9|nr:cyclodeaminase [Bacillus dakarensis]
MIIFTEKELRRFVPLTEKAISVVEEGFTKFASNEVMMPPILRVDIPEHNGEVDVKSAYVKGKDMFAIKVSSGFFNNHLLGMPSGNGLMMLISAKTGVVQAILLDNGYLTEVRTAAAGAIAAKYLARENIENVGVIGAGSQARYQVRALKFVRDFSNVIVYSRSRDRAEKYRREMNEELRINVEVAESAEEVVKNCDLVVTTTPATEPVIKHEWLHPGMHITAMGSDAEHKQELEAEVLVKANKLVCDSKSQCARLGEYHHALEKGILTNKSSVIELGQLTSAGLLYRENDDEITVCDLTGTGVQDTAIALFAYGEMMKHDTCLKVNE